jgi:hypothetical protein
MLMLLLNDDDDDDDACSIQPASPKLKKKK